MNRLLALLAALLLIAAGCVRRSPLALPPPLTSRLQAAPSPAPIFADEQGALRIDQLQLKGSHNSYHRAPRIAVMREFRYSHSAIEQQLSEQGVRHLELDVRFASGALRIGHAPLIDGRTNCREFHDCIRRVKRWSKANPLHVPVFIFVQPKDGMVSAGLDDKLELFDREIGRVFSRHDLLMPRDVARGFPSLRGAVRSIGWPTLDNTRGKVAFVLFGQSRLVHRYARGRPRLDGRSMFVATGSVGAPYAAILSVDDPIAHQSDILHAVQEGFLVRTRADAQLVRSARRRDAALSSGAHFIGSDFVDPALGWLPISAQAPARENPVRVAAATHLRAIAEVERARWARATSTR